jgi:hypothetical protein
MHAGMDLGHSAGRDAPILNVQPGMVERVLRDDDHGRAFNGYGNGVVVHHLADDTWALYAHMDNVEVTEGQPVNAGTRLGTMGGTSNGKFSGMAPHLHLEVRRRRSNGLTPFPSPYPQSVEQPFNNLDPRPWLEAKGLRFARRGGFEILPGSEMDQGGRAAVSGVDPYPQRRIPPWGGGRLFPETALASFDGVDPYPEQRIPPWGGDRLFPETALALGDEGGEYEPPARFDRDVRFGLTPVEWAAIGTGTIVTTGVAVALLVRSRRKRVSPNRRRRTSRR